MLVWCLSAAQEKVGRRVTAGGLTEISWITALWSKGLPQHSIKTTDLMPYGHQHNINWLRSLMAVHKYIYYLSFSNQSVACLMDSTLALHVHHRSCWLVKLILPLTTLSPCGGEAWGKAARASSSTLWRPHVVGFWTQGLQGWSEAKQLCSRQPGHSQPMGPGLGHALFRLWSDVA